MLTSSSIELNIVISSSRAGSAVDAGERKREIPMLNHGWASGARDDSDESATSLTEIQADKARTERSPEQISKTRHRSANPDAAEQSSFRERQQGLMGREERALTFAHLAYESCQRVGSFSRNRPNDGPRGGRCVDEGLLFLCLSLGWPSETQNPTCVLTWGTPTLPQPVPGALPWMDCWGQARGSEHGSHKPAQWTAAGLQVCGIGNK
ncbi:hypothetical protein DL95DRAFT_458417 [Leptodontidium sp. 2 PMI_412]|nr:hypothetical protein DL95DRAFT_458417 [Leptodontidium sp. 2 PMI_412]